MYGQSDRVVGRVTLFYRHMRQARPSPPPKPVRFVAVVAPLPGIGPGIGLSANPPPDRSSPHAHRTTRDPGSIATGLRVP
jgi:hypothetical protein